MKYRVYKPTLFWDIYEVEAQNEDEAKLLMDEGVADHSETLFCQETPIDDYRDEDIDFIPIHVFKMEN